MIFDPRNSSIFGSADMVMENGVGLKEPNQYRDAIIYESISSLPANKIKEFVKSKEAKVMVEEGIISTTTLERLSDNGCCDLLKTTVCHMAKENGDPIWDEFVKTRIEERRIFNDMVSKYGDRAKKLSDSAEKDIVEACIPEYFRTK